jgi:GUN4-like
MPDETISIVTADTWDESPDVPDSDGAKNGGHIGVDWSDAWDTQPNQQAQKQVTKAVESLRLHNVSINKLEKELVDFMQTVDKMFSRADAEADMIVEPIAKSHLIIFPQHATLHDVGKMKVDAYCAQYVNKDLDMAEQWWIRVLAASPGDMDAIKGIKEIAVSRRENEVSSQNNSVGASVENRSQSPFSPKSTSEMNTIPTKADVLLKSERGVDYTKLRDLLASAKWKEADEETTNKILEVAGRTKEGYLMNSDINTFPVKDLGTIDILWVKYSNGHFGFSVQKDIYESLGGTSQLDDTIWAAFGDRVGWRVNGRWLSASQIKLASNPQIGYFPSLLTMWLYHSKGYLNKSYDSGERIRILNSGSVSALLLSHRNL